MKNKKLIKYLRKDIQQSNINNIKNQQQQEKLHKNLNYFGQQKTNSQPAFEEKKKTKKLGAATLQIPKAFKGQKVLQKLQNKLISILSSKQPLITSAEIFQHPNLHKVMGSKNKSADPKQNKNSQPIQEQYYDLQNHNLPSSDQEESQFFVSMNSQYNLPKQNLFEKIQEPFGARKKERVNFLELMEYQQLSRYNEIDNLQRGQRKRQLPIVFEQQLQQSRPKTIYFYP